jgi:hypothetical protein
LQALSVRRMHGRAREVRPSLLNEPGSSSNGHPNVQEVAHDEV